MTTARNYMREKADFTVLLKDNATGNFFSYEDTFHLSRPVVGWRSGSKSNVIKGHFLGLGYVKSLALKFFKDGITDIESIENEFKILNNFKHENIIGMHHILIAKDAERTAFTWQAIALDYCELGSLSLVLPSFTGFNLPPSFIRCVISQVLKGVFYLHSNFIVHNDINCDNILIHADGRVILADFGNAKRIELCDAERLAKSTQTCKEVFVFDDDNDFEQRSVPMISKRGGEEDAMKRYRLPCLDTMMCMENERNYKNELMMPSGNEGRVKAPEQKNRVWKYEYDGAASDAFALGVVLHQLMYSHEPTNAELQRGTFSKRPKEDCKLLPETREWESKADVLLDLFNWCLGIERKEEEDLSEHTDDSLEVLQRMLEVDPTRRVSSRELMVHSWTQVLENRSKAKVLSVVSHLRDIEMESGTKVLMSSMSDYRDTIVNKKLI